MKNKFAIAIVSLMPLLASAQIDIGNEITKQGNSFIRTFSILAIIGLVIVFIFNLEHFTSKQGDTKKGIISLVVYAIIVGFVVVIAQYLRGVSL